MAAPSKRQSCFYFLSLCFLKQVKSTFGEISQSLQINGKCLLICSNLSMKPHAGDPHFCKKRFLTKWVWHTRNFILFYFKGLENDRKLVFHVRNSIQKVIKMQDTVFMHIWVEIYPRCPSLCNFSSCLGHFQTILAFNLFIDYTDFVGKTTHCT